MDNQPPSIGFMQTLPPKAFRVLTQKFAHVRCE